MTTGTITATARMAQALKAEFQQHGIFRSSGFPQHVTDDNGLISDYTGSTCLIANRVVLAVESDYETENNFHRAISAAVHRVTGGNVVDVVQFLNGSSDESVYAMLDTVE